MRPGVTYGQGAGTWCMMRTTRHREWTDHAWHESASPMEEVMPIGVYESNKKRYCLNLLCDMCRIRPGGRDVVHMCRPGNIGWGSGPTMRGMRLQVQCTPHRTVPSYRPASRPSRPRSPSRRRCPSQNGKRCRRSHRDRPWYAPASTKRTPAPPRPDQALAGVVSCRHSTQQPRRSRACEHRPAASCGVGARAAPPQPPHTLAQTWSPAASHPKLRRVQLRPSKELAPPKRRLPKAAPDVAATILPTAALPNKISSRTHHQNIPHNPPDAMGGGLQQML
jgi:hypothetical protein